MSWTQEKVDELILRWNRGESATIVGRAVGMSRNAVIGKVARMRGAGVHLRDAGPSKRSESCRPATVARRVADRIARQSSRERREIVAVLLEPREAPAGGVTFADLEPHHCRYMPGDPRDLVYCGADRVPGSSYCAEHHERCHVRVPVEQAERRAVA